MSEAPVELPVLDTAGARTGRTVVVPSPPPATWREAETGAELELATYVQLERFGCGCIREERLGYAPRAGTRTADHREEDEP